MPTGQRKGKGKGKSSREKGNPNGKIRGEMPARTHGQRQNGNDVPFPTHSTHCADGTGKAAHRLDFEKMKEKDSAEAASCRRLPAVLLDPMESFASIHCKFPAASLEPQRDPLTNPGPTALPCAPASQPPTSESGTCHDVPFQTTLLTPTLRAHDTTTCPTQHPAQAAAEHSTALHADKACSAHSQQHITLSTRDKHGHARRTQHREPLHQIIWIRSDRHSSKTEGGADTVASTTLTTDSIADADRHHRVPTEPR
ncbi:hypothetical protein QBC39DRAFT_144597 [Podospora conica]|nr:hypothetical protein QBC39DRAFT_144597 [Schizothecium conicum]